MKCSYNEILFCCTTFHYKVNKHILTSLKSSLKQIKLHLFVVDFLTTITQHQR